MSSRLSQSVLLNTSRFLAILIAILIVSGGISSARADTYYVSTSGSDSNDGSSPQDAFETITHGATVLQEGDTLIVASGDYDNEDVDIEVSGSSIAPITIRAEEAGGAVLVGDGGGTAFYIENQDHIIIDGFHLENFSNGVYIKYASTYITVTQCTFVNNQNYGLLLYGNINHPEDSHHHVFNFNQFHDYAGSGDGNPLSGSGISDYGIALYFSTDVQASNNFFYGHHHQCLSFKKQMYDSVAASNVFEGAYYTAIYLGQNEDDHEGILRSFNLVAEGNTFSPSPQYRLKSPVRVANVTGAIVRNNFIDAPNGYSGQGIAVDESAQDVMIHHNVIIDSASSNDNPGIRIYADCEIYNNTIVNCDSALEYWNAVQVVVKNNLFINNTQQVRTSESGDYSSSVFEYNSWYPKWMDQGPTDISVDPLFVGPIEPLGYDPYNPSWDGQDLSGNPPPKGDIQILEPDPKFEPDFTRRDAYELSPSSPAIDAGVDVGLPYNGDAPDLGALEYDPGTTDDDDDDVGDDDDDDGDDDDDDGDDDGGGADDDDGTPGQGCECQQASSSAGSMAVCLLLLIFRRVRTS